MIQNRTPLTIPFGVKRLWDEWNVRVVILFSLWLQVLLIFVAPFRKSTRKRKVTFLIWFAYLLADGAATFAIGLISNSQRNQSRNHSNRTNTPASPPNPKENNSDLLAFWAPFLLLHLGGPDTITAFSLEDNELWLRHLLLLGFQAASVIYVFLQSLPNVNLRIPIALMFMAGIIKYIERSAALYFASLDTFQDSILKTPEPGPDYAKLMEEYTSRKEAKFPVRIDMTLEPDEDAKDSDVPDKDGVCLNNLKVVHYAFKYFQTFKGLIVDHIFSFRERKESRDFFNRRTAEDALRIIEVELNFIYGAFYTKVKVVNSTVGRFFRFIAFGLVVATLGIIHFQAKLDEFQGVDIGITYTLLLGAIALDVIGFLMLIFSDRKFASIKDPERPLCKLAADVFSCFLALKEPWWHPCKCEIQTDGKKIRGEHNILATPLLFRRWSGSVSAHNLVRYCLKSSSTTIHEFPSLFEIISEKISCFLGINEVTKTISRPFIKVRQFLRYVFEKITEPFKDFVAEILYVSSETLTKELWEFIFSELKRKSEFADTPETAKRISSARGDWVLTDAEDPDRIQNRRKLLKYLSDVQYDESLLLWHIATDLCYYSDENKVMSKDNHSYRQFSKILSDYMLYLLVFRQTMMLGVTGIGKKRFRDTCAEAQRFFKRWSLQPNEDRKACEEILKVNIDIEPATVKGDRSKSVLFDASILAKELHRMENEKGEDKWKLMSKVWVELVSYAACHCRASTHAQQVSKGGELISFLWLLMVHFGLGEQFQINEGHARANLIVGK